MSISESRFRQILREEARRVVREGDSTMNEGLFDQLSNAVTGALGGANPMTNARMFKKKVPAFMDAYEIYKKLKSEYTRFHREDRGHRSMDAFGGFTPERVESIVSQMERIADRTTNVKDFYRSVDIAIGGGKTWNDLLSALRLAERLMADLNPRRAIGEEYFDMSAKHLSDMEAADRRRDAERARERDLDRYNRRGGGGGGGSSDEPDRPGRMHGVGGRHTGPLDPDAQGTLIGA